MKFQVTIGKKNYRNYRKNMQLSIEKVYEKWNWNLLVALFLIRWSFILLNRGRNSSSFRSIIYFSGAFTVRFSQADYHWCGNFV